MNRVGNDLSDLILNNEVIKSIDESLTWKELYKTIKNKFKGGMNSNRKLKETLLQRKLEQVYQALFTSLLRYGDIISNALSSTKLFQLR